MDWAKAKTILIIALLAICMILGGILAARAVNEKAADAAAADAALKYLEMQGISFNCDMPEKRPSLPVLFVHFNPAYLNRTNILTEYEGVGIVAGGQPGYVPELSSAGKAKAKVITASSAVLKALAEAGDPKGLEISSVELVYYVDPEGFDPDSEDTAVPCWAVRTNRGTFYINAYNL